MFNNDFISVRQDFSVQSQKLDYNLDILDGVINNSYVKPLYAKVDTDVYILDSGCFPLVKSFVNDSVGYHGVAVSRTLNITLPIHKTSIKCIKTLPASGSGKIGKYIRALKYILSLKKTKRTIINISASVQSDNYTKINQLIKSMAKQGYEFVLASGNLGTNSPLGPDACKYSLTNLAWMRNVYVVGTPELYSRTGKCVEFFYPGSYRTVHPFSGSSFATPAFAGILACK